MAALEGLAHQLNISDAFERVVGAPFCQIDQIGNDVFAHFFGIDKMGHAQFFSQSLARWIDIDADNHVGTGQPGALHHVQANAA